MARISAPRVGSGLKLIGRNTTTTASTVGLPGPNDGQLVDLSVFRVYSLTVFGGDPQERGAERTFHPEGAPTLKLP